VEHFDSANDAIEGLGKLDMDRYTNGPEWPIQDRSLDATGRNHLLGRPREAKEHQATQYASFSPLRSLLEVA
jgi:hypothetical protein